MPASTPPSPQLRLYRTSSTKQHIDADPSTSRPASTSPSRNKAPQIHVHDPSEHLQFPLATSADNSMDRPLTPTSMDDATDSEDAHSSLSDSTYEIISASSYRSDDDVSHNSDGRRDRDADGMESVISFGAATPDGSETSVNGEEEHRREFFGVIDAGTSGFAENEDAFQDVTSPQTIATPGSIVTPKELEVDEHLATPSLNSSTVRASTLSDVTTTSQHSHEDWIRFREPISSIADGLVDVTKTPRGTWSAHLSTGTRIVIPRAINSENLVPKKRFRILYFGSVVHKIPVIKKITQALTVSNGMGDDGCEIVNTLQVRGYGIPQTVLVPSTGLELEIIQCCTHINPTACSVCSCALLPPYDVLPSGQTLAIFVHPGSSQMSPDDQREHLRENSFAQSARCPVPHLDICLTTDYSTLAGYQSSGRPFQPWGNVALHVTTGSTETDGTTVRMPIDFETFAQLDPRDVNSNLASMFALARNQNSVASRVLRQTKQFLNSLWTLVVTIASGIKAGLMNFHAYLEHEGAFETIEGWSLLSPRKIRTAWDERSWYKFISATGGFAWFALLLLMSVDIFVVHRPSVISDNQPVKSLDPVRALLSSSGEKATMTATTNVVRATPSDRGTSLSVVDSEKSLVAVSPVPQPRQGWFSKAPRWELSKDEKQRLFLTHSNKVKKPFLIFLGTPLAQDIIQVGVSASRTREAPGALFQRINASTIELMLPSPPYCGQVNVTVAENCTSPHEFTFDRPCEEVAVTRELQLFYYHYLRWPYQDTVHALEGVAQRMRSLPRESYQWLDSLASYEPSSDSQLAGWKQTAEQIEEAIDAKALVLYHDAIIVYQDALARSYEFAQQAQSTFKSLKTEHEPKIWEASRKFKALSKASLPQNPSMTVRIARSRALIVAEQAKHALSTWRQAVTRKGKELKKWNKKMTDKMQSRKARRAARGEHREKRKARRHG